MLKRLFFDPKRYDLGRVGRHKINQKLGLKVSEDERILTKDDFIAAMKYLRRTPQGRGNDWTISITSAAAVSAPWANCWPINAGLAWPAPSAWSASA